MKFEKIHNKGQAKIIQEPIPGNAHKDFHPLVIWGLYTPVIVFMLYRSYVKEAFTVSYIALVFLAGMFFWTLFEYVMHRFAFHFVAESERAPTHYLCNAWQSSRVPQG